MSRRSVVLARTLAAGVLLAAASCSRRDTERGADQLSFGTPDEASAALVAALERNDVPTLRRMLGSDTEGLLSSGDTVADRRERDSFLARYRARHQLVAGGPDDLTLQVGEDDWPLPIPLVRRAGRWRFDGEAGVHELLLRRIGANELRTIDVMRGFVAAQEEYAAVGHDDLPAGIYAGVLRSEPGRQNGLYWQVEEGEPPSPAGPLLAAASAEGYAASARATAPAPYHGYVYRMLRSQGPAASGGAREYVVDGVQSAGFALLARPQTYGASGLMTFIVNQDGVVWQRDLGEQTSERAAAIQRFDPDSTWTPIPPEQEGGPTPGR